MNKTLNRRYQINKPSIPKEWQKKSKYWPKTTITKNKQRKTKKSPYSSCNQPKLNINVRSYEKNQGLLI